MTVLGIDPGYDRVGWAILETNSTAANGSPLVKDLGLIQTQKNSSLVKRYQQITSELEEVVSQWQPDKVAIESIFFSKNQKTAIKVSEARGVILAAILPHCQEITEFTPNQIKLAVTGYGNADKQAVEKMVRMQLKLPNKPVIDDTIDAVATAFTQLLTNKS